MDIFSQIKTSLVSNFNMTDVKIVYNLLHFLHIIAWSCRERKDPEVRIHVHHVTNDLSVCVIAGTAMSLVFAHGE